MAYLRKGTAFYPSTVTAGILGSGVTGGSGLTTPAGRTVLHKTLLRRHNNATKIETANSIFTDTGLAGSFATVKASTGSYLTFWLYLGMTFTAAGIYGETTMTLRQSSDTTTYAVGDDMLGGTTYWNRLGSGDQIITPMHLSFCSGSDTATTDYVSNISSWSAAETLYWRIYFKVGYGSGNYRFYHEDSTCRVWVEEIAV